MSDMSTWLWPDRTVGKRESRALRDSHNAVVNEYVALLADYRKLRAFVVRAVETGQFAGSEKNNGYTQARETLNDCPER